MIDFPYFKLSIANPDLHVLACLHDAGYNTAIIASCHNSIPARQNRIGIQRLQPSLHASNVRRLQLDVVEQRGMGAARQFVHALALRLDSTIRRDVSKLGDKGG